MTISTQTPEKPRRFVILRHVDREGTHFDLMIEYKDVLWTWKFSEWPDGVGEKSHIGQRIADHRPIYLEYEGPISGDRGMVTRVDWGDCIIEQESHDGYLVRFSGTIFTGRFSLTPAASQSWALRRLEA